MKFSIITPSFNQLGCLKRCVASVADQQGVDVEHIVMDGGSTDGTVEFLEEHLANSSELKANGYSFSYISEKDDGMYDALNKGFSRASGELFAWLNCDEQYLPGTLQKVVDFYATNPSVDILFGGMLMVNPEGEFLACRKAMPMRRNFLEASYLYNYSCAMFVRESLWKRLGGFDVEYENAGDEEWVRRALSIGAKSETLNDYLSSFAYSDQNLSSLGGALKEHEALKQRGSAASRIFKLPINLLRLMEKGFRGGHIQKTPIDYEIYTKNTGERTMFEVATPTTCWPDAKKPYLLSHRLK